MARSTTCDPANRATLIEWLDSMCDAACDKAFEQSDYYVNNIEALRRREGFRWDDLLVTTALPERNRTRLIGFLGRLGSDYAAERAAAVAMMGRVRQGLSWDRLIVGTSVVVDPPHPAPKRPPPPDARVNDVKVNKVAGWIMFALCMVLVISIKEYWAASVTHIAPIQAPVPRNLMRVDAHRVFPRPQIDAPPLGQTPSKPAAPKPREEIAPPSALFATTTTAREVTWRGSYDCHGDTALHLVMEITKIGSVYAVSQFGPTIDNPTVPKGVYSLRGSIQPNGYLHLEPAAWISQPHEQDYTMLVGFSGFITGNVYRGSIDSNVCGTFSMIRAN